MAEKIEVKMPADQQEGTTSVIGSWLKNVGDNVTQNEPLLEISTDKVTVEVSAPASGVLSKILKEPNDSVTHEDVLGIIEVGAVGKVSAGSMNKEQALVERAANCSKPASLEDLTPAVRRLLKEHNLDPASVSGTGREGRITLEDVERALASRGKTPSAASGNPSQGIPSHRQPHSAVRKIIAQAMQSSVQNAPHVTSVFQADLSAVIAHREANKAEFEKRGIKLTFTSYFVAAAAKALNAVPEVNSRWHDDALEIFDEINIGVGTAVAPNKGNDAGLVVPVVRSADSLSLEQLATSLQDLTTRARQGALQPSEVRGGTFTISNHGVTGSLLAAPIIINQPQSAILGIGKLEKRAVVETRSGKDELVIKPLIYVTLTIDHRVLDGFKANQFLEEFIAGLRV